MAEEEGLRPILNWAKRLIDRILVEDFGEHDVEFMFGQDERIDPSEQAQILTAYISAGVITRNEARMKLGLAPVEDSAANELTVTTGAGAAPVTAPGENLVKYDPNQPRDKRGRWTTEAGGTTPGAAPDDVAALAFSDPENPHNPARMIGNALDAILDVLDRHKSRNEPPPPAPSSKPREERPEDGEATENPRAPRFEGDNLGPPLNEPPKDKPLLPVPPTLPQSDDHDEDQEPKPATIRPTEFDIHRLVDEHSRGFKLTTKAAEKIVELTQPEGTKPDVVGKHITGPDIIYRDSSSSVRVSSVEVRTASNLDRAEDAARTALKKPMPPNIVALQIPADTDVPRLLGKFRSFDRAYAAGRSVLAVDPDSNILIKLQPFP